MTTKTCTACASSNAPDAAFCSQCGSPFETTLEAAAISSLRPVEPTAETVQPPPPLPPPQPIAAQQPIQPPLPREPEKRETPCLVKVVGSFFGCLFGLITGLCLSLICVMPVAYAIGGGGGSPMLEGAILVTVLLVIFTVVMGIINGPYLLGELLSAIGATFKWMTGSKN